MIDNIIIGLIGILIGMFITIGIVNIKWEHHDTIIKQGYGQYNNITGDFEWKYPIEK